MRRSSAPPWRRPTCTIAHATATAAEFEKHGQGSGNETAGKFSSECGLERTDDDAAEAKPNQVRPRPAAVEHQEAQGSPDHERDGFNEDFRHHDRSFVSGCSGGS